MAEKQPSHPTPNAVPPYVPYRSFKNFIDGLKQGMPSRIDRSVMPSMSGAMQSQLTAALRFLGLITANGLPTEGLSRLVNSEGPERLKTMSLMLHGSYPFLFQGFNLKTATPRMVEEQFAEAGASGGTIDKCVNFFMSAAKEAEIDLSPHLKNMRGARASRAKRVTAREVSLTQNDAAQTTSGSSEPSGNMSWAQLLLSKFPSFDPSWPDEVKAKWFNAFDELMKQGKEKGF